MTTIYLAGDVSSVSDLSELLSTFEAVVGQREVWNEQIDTDTLRINTMDATESPTHSTRVSIRFKTKETHT